MPDGFYHSLYSIYSRYMDVPMKAVVALRKVIRRYKYILPLVVLILPKLEDRRSVQLRAHRS